MCVTSHSMVDCDLLLCLKLITDGSPASSKCHILIWHEYMHILWKSMSYIKIIQLQCSFETRTLSEQLDLYQKKKKLTALIFFHCRSSSAFSLVSLKRRVFRPSDILMPYWKAALQREMDNRQCLYKYNKAQYDSLPGLKRKDVLQFCKCVWSRTVLPKHLLGQSLLVIHVITVLLLRVKVPASQRTLLVTLPGRGERQHQLHSVWVKINDSRI